MKLKTFLDAGTVSSFNLEHGSNQNLVLCREDYMLKLELY